MRGMMDDTNDLKRIQSNRNRTVLGGKNRDFFSENDGLGRSRGRTDQAECFGFGQAADRGMPMLGGKIRAIRGGGVFMSRNMMDRAGDLNRGQTEGDRQCQISRSGPEFFIYRGQFHTG